MVDDSCGGSNSESSAQMLSGQIEWVKFDELDKESNPINCPAEEKPPEENRRYLSRLGEFK